MEEERRDLDTCLAGGNMGLRIYALALVWDGTGSPELQKHVQGAY